MWKKLLMIFLIIVGILTYGVYWAFFDMGRLPEGEFIAESTSPDGCYTVKAYVTNGGATTSYAVRGELNFNQETRNPKNIYWQYKIETASITLCTGCTNNSECSELYMYPVHKITHHIH